MYLSISQINPSNVEYIAENTGHANECNTYLNVIIVNSSSRSDI